ncbi:MAG: PAS domain-containing protein [Deltaproteobacteria bacterium]|nr:PAS domain-containing protein [Deltaproteobacteria bacterium]
MELALDIRTLFAALMGVFTCLATALCFISFTQKNYPGFKQWTLGAVIMAVAYLLFMLRGPMPKVVSVMVGNPLLAVSAALFLAGTRRFLDLKPWPKFQVAVPLACLGGLAWFYWVNDLFAIRVVVISVAGGLLLSPVAWLLAAHAPRGHRTLYVGTGVVFALFCASMLMRAADTIMGGRQVELFGQDPLQALMFLFMLMSQASWIIGLMLINSQRMSDELRLSRAELAANVDNMERILDFLPDPTWVVDNLGRVTYWNQAMERLTGVKASQILGKGEYEYALSLYGERRPCLIDLMLNSDPAWERRYANLERRGDMLATYEAFLPALGEDGRFVAGSATCLLDEKGRMTGAVETLRDITKDKRSVQEREKLIRELTAALEKVQTLKGLIPICSHCKSIRRDEGYWEQLETFIADHAEVEFSHGICPDCIEKYYRNPTTPAEGKTG